MRWELRWGFSVKVQTSTNTLYFILMTRFSLLVLGFDKTLTPGQLTPLLTPPLTHYKINGKMNTAFLSRDNPF